jgi:glutamate racemase
MRLVLNKESDKYMLNQGPIGVFDSGYGGLTVLKEFVNRLPQYDYIYLGDNARAPYGTRSFDTVYHYTLECVTRLFEMGCPLVILACNTASAKALRTIQQNDLPKLFPDRKILGVIRPTTELLGSFSRTKQVGVFATSGTVISDSYPIEVNKFSPEVKVFQEACPIWVPLVESNEHVSEGANYFIKKHVDHLLEQSPLIDTILLGCTHYPLLEEKIKAYLPKNITLLSQGAIVANSLIDYLKRHPEIESRITKNATCKFYTTDDPEDFDAKAGIFFEGVVKSERLVL